MSNLMYKTKDGTLPNGKLRVLFLCHPDDFERTFSIICDDFFELCDCAIFYILDSKNIILDENWEIDIKNMNMVVISVTTKLVATKNRIIDVDLKLAKNNGVPVLPIMIDVGIDNLYNSSERFGTIQYIKRYNQGSTEIKYRDKLKSYLSNIIIDPIMSKRVREAFDIYIFLSYRKIDRACANWLIHTIHEIPEYRGIAIWYDEFLIPGERFDVSIKEAIEKSKYFMLLITPNLLLNQPDGSPNYIEKKEYPLAKSLGKDVIPVEIIFTDKEELNRKYKGLPKEYATIYENEYEKERLLSNLKKTCSIKNNNPEREYLLGLAYYNGIDVECNHFLGITLIHSAACNHFLEAMEKMRLLCKNDVIPAFADKKDELMWAQFVLDEYISIYGEKHLEIIPSMCNLADAHIDQNEYDVALSIHKEIYDIFVNHYGELDINSLKALTNVAKDCSLLGQYDSALRYYKNVYIGMSQTLGILHNETLLVLNAIALTYAYMEDKANAYKTKVDYCNYLRKKHGNLSQEALVAVSELAFMLHMYLDNTLKALEVEKIVYFTCLKYLGIDHPVTMDAQFELIILCASTNNKNLFYKLYQNIMQMDKPPIGSLNALAYQFSDLGHFTNSNFEHRVRAKYDEVLC